MHLYVYNTIIGIGTIYTDDCIQVVQWRKHYIKSYDIWLGIVYLNIIYAYL